MKEKDDFSDALLKTLNSVYEKFSLLKKMGSIYIVGYDKTDFSFDIPKEGGDIAIAYPETDYVVIDKDCVVPFTKKYLQKTGGWKSYYNNIDALKGFTAGCIIFSDYMKMKKKHRI
jgi:hypothetical protein